MSIGDRPFENANYLCEILTKDIDMSKNITNVFKEVHKQKGRDSATIIGWSYFNNYSAPTPSG